MPRPGALVRSGRAAASRRHRGRPRRLVGRAAARRSPTPAGSTTSPRSRSAGQQHGMVVLDADGRVIRPALLWNDTRSAQAARDLIDEVGADEYAAAHRASCRSRRSPRRSCAGCATPSPENAARVAAVALPHDWLTWRLRGYGPAGESPLGPVLDELTTDRSDASGTAYWGRTATTTATCSSARSATTRSSPACSARGEAPAARPPASLVGAGRRRQRRRPRSASTRRRRRRRLDRHERHGLRRDGCPDRRRLGHRRRASRTPRAASCRSSPR